LRGKKKKKRAGILIWAQGGRLKKKKQEKSGSHPWVKQCRMDGVGKRLRKTGVEKKGKNKVTAGIANHVAPREGIPADVRSRGKETHARNAIHPRRAGRNCTDNSLIGTNLLVSGLLGKRNRFR